MNYDYAKIAKEVIQAVGGSENIKSAAHCATRLRLIVAHRSLADNEKAGEIDAVKGTFFTAGQYQIIFGTGHVNRVYEQITQLGIAETTASEAKEAKMDGKNQVHKSHSYLWRCFCTCYTCPGSNRSVSRFKRRIAQ